MVSILANGAYKLSSRDTQLPLKPDCDFVNSYIVADQFDHSDTFKWILTHVHGSTFTIQNVKYKDMYVYCGSGSVIPQRAVAVASTSKQFYVIRSVPGRLNTYTIATLDGNLPLLLEKPEPGSKLIASKGIRGWKYKKARESHGDDDDDDEEEDGEDEDEEEEDDEEEDADDDEDDDEDGDEDDDEDNDDDDDEELLNELVELEIERRKKDKKKRGADKRTHWVITPFN